MVSELTGQQAVAHRWGASPLDVTEDGDPGIIARFLGNVITYLKGWACLPTGARNGFYAFSHNHNIVRLTRFIGLNNLATHLVHIVGNLGNQNHIRTPGNTRIQGDVTGVAAHYLDHINPFVAGSRIPQLVHSIQNVIYRCVKADGIIGTGYVVINGGWDTDHIHTRLG